MSLASILKSRATQGSAKQDGLVITDPAIVAQAAEWLTAKRGFDAAESAKKTSEAALKPMLLTEWLEANHNSARPESSIKILTPAGKVTCSFQARWFPKAPLTSMGVPPEFVRNRASITIDMDKVPESKQEELATKILAVVDGLGCAEAADIKFTEHPTATFETGRHTLPPERNLAFETAGLGTVVSLRA